MLPAPLATCTRSSSAPSTEPDPTQLQRLLCTYFWPRNEAFAPCTQRWGEPCGYDQDKTPSECQVRWHCPWQLGTPTRFPSAFCCLWGQAAPSPGKDTAPVPALSPQEQRQSWCAWPQAAPCASAMPPPRPGSRSPATVTPQTSLEVTNRSPQEKQATSQSSPKIPAQGSEALRWTLL